MRAIQIGVFYSNQLNDQCIINIMLSEQIITQNGQNRRNEKSRVRVSQIISQITTETYQSLIQWIFEACNQMKLQNNTKALARTYFDLTVTAYTDLQVSQYLPLFLACLSIAIKFYELREISEKLTPQVLLQSAQLTISREQYFNLEVKILMALKGKLNITTPYDYIVVYLARFPFLPKLKNVLPTIIQFALIQPRACEFTSEEIFYGSVLSLFAAQKVALNDFQRDVLSRLTDGWDNAHIMSNLITQGIEKYGSQNKNY